MRRTTTRSSRQSSGARRAASGRSRSARSRRPARPQLTPRQVREIAGVLLILASLFGLLAIGSSEGSILIGLRDWLRWAFGNAWYVPVFGGLGLGAYLLWPKAPRPRLVDLVAGTVAVFSLFGLFGLIKDSGGAVGRTVDGAVMAVAGFYGAWALPGAGPLIWPIVNMHFCPRAILARRFPAPPTADAGRQPSPPLGPSPGW